MRNAVISLIPTLLVVAIAAATPIEPPVASQPANRIVLRDVVGIRPVTVDFVYLIHADGFTFAQYGDLRIETASVPNQFGFQKFNIAPDASYASATIDTPDDYGVPVAMQTEFHSLIGSTAGGLTTAIKVKHMVTTSCAGLTATQCAKRHNAFLIAMMKKYPPVR